ncbi:MAG TPA: MMPL family transporter [Solirubrobacterales bacterium]
MVALDRWVRRHRRLVLVVWALLFLVTLPLGLRQWDNLTSSGFASEDAESSQVEEVVEANFPEAEPPRLAIVLIPSPEAGATDLERAAAGLRRVAAGVEGIVVPREAAPAGAGREPLLVPLDVPDGEQAAIDAAEDLRERIEGLPEEAESGVTIRLAGQGALWEAFHHSAEDDIRVAEIRAFPLVAAVLLIVFGSLLAALLPLSIGVVAVTLTGATIYLLSLHLDFSVYAPNMASMLGVGVAVDYSLFVVARYREELRGGHDVEGARAAAMATSGVAVAFSGLTVIASLAGLFLFDSTALRSMATGAILVIGISVLAAATLLPALISLSGRRLGQRWSFGRRRHAARPESGFWWKWTRLVTQRPLVSALAAAALLLAMAAPALDLRLGNEAQEQLSPGDEARLGTEAAARIAGPGALGPTFVLVDLKSADGGEGLLARLRAAGEAQPGVEAVAAPKLSADGERALLTVTLGTSPESEEARRIVHRLRAALPPLAAGEATVRVGGTTATIDDFDTSVSSSLWQLILFVVVVSFVALAILLRSLVLPLKAVLMNVLSVAAAYGVLVAVFQWGWLEPLGLDSSPRVDTITPPLVLAIAFGLSMDYEAFLLTRIRERYLATGDNRRAVAEGLERSAATITSATVIMVGVFLAFVSAGLPAVQRVGLTLAAAITIDATVVRLVLVPALMVLLGRLNWWMPRWLSPRR